MNSLNSIVLEGNLTKDADHLTTPKGTEVCRFSVASNRYYQQDDQKKEEVSFGKVMTFSRFLKMYYLYLKRRRKSNGRYYFPKIGSRLL